MIKRTAEQRFLALVTVLLNGCWDWNGYRTPPKQRRNHIDVGGYGMFWNGAKTVIAHRWAYEHWVGPIPVGMQLDHFVCENRGCVNPAHVRPVTPRENTLRGDTFTAAFLARTHCDNGHAFDEANTQYRKHGARVCRTCHNEYKRAWRQARRDVGLPVV